MRHKGTFFTSGKLFVTIAIISTSVFFFILGRNTASTSQPKASPNSKLVVEDIWVDYEQPEMGIKFKHPNWLSPYFYGIGYKTFKSYNSVELRQQGGNFNIEIAIYEDKSYLTSYQTHVAAAKAQEFFQTEKLLYEDNLNGKKVYKFSYIKDNIGRITNVTYIPLSKDKYLEFAETVEDNYTYYNNISNKILTSLEFTPE